MTLESLATAAPSRWAVLMTRPGPRLVALGLLLLVLLVPLSMIESRVSERGLRRDAAVAGVAQSWGGRQILAGPLLRLPYRMTVRESVENGRVVERVRDGWVTLPPQRLEAQVQLDSQRRRRGIFEVPLFSAAADLQGRFMLPDAAELPVPLEALDVSRAELVVGLSEPGSLSADSAVQVAGQTPPLAPSAPGLGGPGVHARVSGLDVAALHRGLDFRLGLRLKGSQAFRLAPVARQTTLALRSDWPHPGFGGQGLPATSRVAADGFSAEWSTSYLGRGYPPAWRDAEVGLEQIEGSAFGVDLVVPVDAYRMAQRIAKYGALLVLLSFAAVWVSELLGGQPLHPVQYLLLGAALCLFGLLQLALAEHLGFDLAFWIAALAVIAQAGAYLRSATGSSRRAAALVALLAAWFGYLYAVLQSEDLAFLLGALALFGALSGVMWSTRKADWTTGGSRWEVAGATLE